MKILVIGLGRRGSAVAAMLADEGHDVTVVDTDVKAVSAFTDRHDANGVAGIGTAKDVLMRAGVQTTDLVVAITGSDEVNMLCCMQAKACGAGYTVAAVTAHEADTGTADMARMCGVDMILNPELETAKYIAEGLRFPFEVKEKSVWGNDVILFELLVRDNDSFVDRSLWEIRVALPEANFLVVTVLRGKALVIPGGDFRLRSGDRVEIVSTQKTFGKIARKLGYAGKKTKECLMVGCGTTGYYLAKLLTEKEYRLKILDFDKENCLKLNDLLPTAEVMYGNAENVQTLIESGLSTADACLLMTGDDRTNLIVDMFAFSLGNKNVVVKINDDAFGGMLKRIDMGMRVSESEITAEKIRMIARELSVGQKGANRIFRLHRIAENRAEAVEFEVPQGFAFSDIPLRSPAFRMKKNLLIACIIRGGSVIIPNGDSVIQTGDRVVVISDAKNALSSPEQIFTQK